MNAKEPTLPLHVASGIILVCTDLLALLRNIHRAAGRLLRQTNKGESAADVALKTRENNAGALPPQVLGGSWTGASFDLACFVGAAIMLILLARPPVGVLKLFSHVGAVLYDRKLGQLFAQWTHYNYSRSTACTSCNM
jgi:hypothetical protein